MSKTHRKTNPFVAFCSTDEVLVTTVKDEDRCIEEWFVRGLRKMEDYERYICTERTMQLFTTLSVGNV